MCILMPLTPQSSPQHLPRCRDSWPSNQLVYGAPSPRTLQKVATGGACFSPKRSRKADSKPGKRAEARIEGPKSSITPKEKEAAIESVLQAWDEKAMYKPDKGERSLCQAVPTEFAEDASSWARLHQLRKGNFQKASGEPSNAAAKAAERHTLRISLRNPTNSSFFSLAGAWLFAKILGIPVFSVLPTWKGRLVAQGVPVHTMSSTVDRALCRLPFEKQKTLHLGVRRLMRMLLDSLLQARLCRLAFAWMVHCRLDLCCVHGSAPCSLGKEGFLGAVAMPGLLDVEALSTGWLRWTGWRSAWSRSWSLSRSCTLDWSWWLGWLVGSRLPLLKPSLSLRTTCSLEPFEHAHRVDVDLLRFIHDLILEAIAPHSKSGGLKLELLKVALELCKILKRRFLSKITNVIDWLRAL